MNIDSFVEDFNQYLNAQAHLEPQKISEIQTKIQALSQALSSKDSHFQQAKELTELSQQIQVLTPQNFQGSKQAIFSRLNVILQNIHSPDPLQKGGEIPLDMRIDPKEAEKIHQAKELIAKDAEEFLRTVKDFGITNQSALVELAKLVAQKNGGLTSFYIQNYGIEDEEKRFEIAKIAAQIDGEYTSFYIQNYAIKDKDKRFEIAKLAVQQNGEASKHVQKYGIEDEDKRFEVAKLAVGQSRDASKHIQEFRIIDQEKLFEIAKCATQKKACNPSIYIRLYGIQDKEKRFEVAKLSAQQSGSITSMEIGQYDLIEEEKRFEVAKLAAQENGIATSRNIEEYKINDADKLFEIAKICAKKGGTKFLSHFDNFGIKDDEKIREILLLACTGDIKCLDSIALDHLSASNRDVFQNLQNLSQGHINEIGEWFSKQWPGQFESVFKEIGRLENPQKLAYAKEWLIKTAAYLHLRPPLETDAKLWLTVYKYPDPAMRLHLTARAARTLSNPQQFNTYQSLIKGDKGIIMQHLLLPALFFSNRPVDEVKSVVQSIRNQRLFFKEGSNLKNLIDALSLLTKGGKFSNQEINFLLKKAIDQAEKGTIKTNLFALQGIIACRGVLKLKEAVAKQDFDLKEIYQTVFKEVIDMGEIKDFANKYEKTFGKSPLTSSLLTYASRLKQLPDREQQVALPLLAVYTRSVLEDTFTQERYNTQHSAHLSAIFKDNPELEQKWRKNHKIAFNANEIQAEKKPFDYKFFLLTKIVADKHLNHDDYPYIVNFLKTGDMAFSSSLDKQIDQNKDQPTLLLQRHLIDLVNTQDSSKQQQLLSRIEELLQDLPCELLNDIKGLTQQKKLKEPNNWTLDNTDDFDALLNCGTYITGSCQRVDGSPELNKCLLAYLMDGKNRLLAIRDERGVIIARSIVRLLLDGKQPALFQERIYPDKLDYRYEQALNQFAVDQARNLDLPLYSTGANPLRLQSLGGRAPWEYVDALGAAGMGQDSSVFAITHVQQVFDPSKKIRLLS